MRALLAWLPAACLGAAFALATAVEPWFQTWQGATLRQGGALRVLLGDSRRMFANHFYLKADAYFHSGYYPSIFDRTEGLGASHMVTEAGAAEEGPACAHDFLGKPHDWIEAFGRKLYPSVHTHLGEDAPGDPGACACGHEHEQGHEHGEAHGEELGAEQVREILPWLRMSVELDPHRVESYMVAAYWLRERMDRVDEAEQFLREGLRANPDSYEILFELGRVAFDNRKDLPRARMLWELALQRWQRTQADRSEPDLHMLRQIMSYRALLEEQAGDPRRALQILEEARTLSRGSPVFDQRIDRLRQGLPASP